MLTLAPSKLSTEHSFFHTEVAVNKWEVDWLTLLVDQATGFC